MADIEHFVQRTSESESRELIEKDITVIHEIFRQYLLLERLTVRSDLYPFIALQPEDLS